jgi:phosphate-selective porin OprO/OprP
LQITGEYINTWVQRDAVDGFSGTDLHFHGGYIFASYFLTGEYIPYKRTRGTIDRVKPLENFFLVERCRGGCGRGWGALALALRYDFLDVTDSDIQGGRGHAWTAGLNWYWTAYSKLQTNVVWGSIKDAGEAQFPSPTFAGIGGDFSILGMRYMIDF